MKLLDLILAFVLFDIIAFVQLDLDVLTVALMCTGILLWYTLFLRKTS